jgi:transcriptional regulator with XRE-family HTH domain
MQPNGAIQKTHDREYERVAFSLRDLRTAKGLSQSQIAQVLRISKALYNFVENGKRRPNIDLVYKLSLLHQTSMDFIYHAFYRQHMYWHFPEHDLQYALRLARLIDIQYIKERQEPIAPPHIPSAFVTEAAKCGRDRDPDFRPYGLERPDLTMTAAEEL